MVVLAVIAILWNVFNLAVTILHQWKTGGYQPIGLIISCISVGNVLLQLSMFTVLLFVWADMLFSAKCLPVLRVIIFIWIQSNCVSFWSIAWLSVYYCVKIIRASNTLLCKLKRNISSFINMALLLTVLCSFIACLPLLSLQLSPVNGTAPNETQNTTGTSLKIVLLPWIDETLYIQVLMGFLCPVPVLIMLPTSLRLVAHLCHHTLVMKKNNNQFQGTDSYLLVCKLTVSMVL
ncbi:hypothetical protein AAFF_G00129640 [Aldrovandia affinis]|uniref:Taste receptor type 2 member 40 n=1 Tax=Aldrovandia affinis TaxID=143900 RepID=A0AAD7RTI9_9TELE|nr:hypothetical protein AAFF_G00129640 [Aldrovandia affinis]